MGRDTTVQLLHKRIVRGNGRARGGYWRRIGAEEQVLVGNGQVRQEVLDEEYCD